MRKTINDILREQSGKEPIIDINGNPTRKVFDGPSYESEPELTFGKFLKITLDRVIKTIYNHISVLKK